jgi:hypothetical protein
MAHVGGKNGTEGPRRCPQNLQGPVAVTVVQLLLNFSRFRAHASQPNSTRHASGCSAYATTGKKPQGVVALQEQRFQPAAR